jgi:hypothetical protein
MSYVVLLLVSVGVTIYALVDCWRSTDDEVRGLPRPAWILLIILIGPLGVPPFGALGYLLFGRPPMTAMPGPRTVAPDDDPEFLRLLDQQRRQSLSDERRREQRERKDEQRERKERERQQRKEQRDGPSPGAAGSETEGDGQPGRWRDQSPP